MGLMIHLQPAFGRALVVGGGKVAVRKVKALADAEFEVSVISPVVAEEIRLAPFVTVIERKFEPADVDVDRYAIVFACTDDREVNAAIGQAARAKGLPVLVADSQAESTFFTPAVLRDGGLVVGVSTGGASPTLARKIREQIAASIGVGWQRALLMARQEREERLGRAEPANVEEDE
jgi:siroheme synthase-like protein